MERSGIEGGLAVYAGFEKGRDLVGLHPNDRFLVHGLTAGSKKADKARDFIRRKGLYGKITAEQWNGNKLPHTDDLVNLLVVRDHNGMSENEIRRVLAPGGTAFIMKNGNWEQYKNPWPDDIDEWTHHFHGPNNNAVSHDTKVAPPRHLQWKGYPLYCRSHELESSVMELVSSGGRIFYILDTGPPGIKDSRLPATWSLISRDGFSGVTLWEREIPNWGWKQWNKEGLEGEEWIDMVGRNFRYSFPNILHRRLVAAGEKVYITLGYHAPVSVLDAATGEKIKTLRDTEGTEEIVCIDHTLVIRIINRYRGDSASFSSPESIVAINTNTGEILWEQSEKRLIPLTLAVNEGRVHYAVPGKVKTLDLSGGEKKWECGMKARKLVAYQDGVFILSPERGGWSPGILKALRAETGEEMWTGPPLAGNNLFIANELVWYGQPRQKYRTNDWLAVPLKDTLQTFARMTGYDPWTGEVKKRIQVRNLFSPGHHYRCYPPKATDNYLMWDKRGVEFMDIKGDDHMRHNWVRGACDLGLVPANGLLYAPPHQCFCYPSSKLNGFNALSAPSQEAEQKMTGSILRKGPAYGFAAGRTSSPEENEWPTFRHDHKRSGATAGQLPLNLGERWEKKLGGKLTQPVITDGKLFVAQIDQHCISCISSEDGKLLWSFTAGGRIDSPPGFYQGRILFGAHDGWVYCLRADNGELIWKFRAAPSERRIVAFNQLESPWPVHGSVLIVDGVAYFAAGRSSFLDGGIFLYGIDPASGEKQYEYRMEGPFPEIPGGEPGRPFDMEGSLSDVLVSQDGYIYMKNVKFNKKLQKQETPGITQLGDKNTGLHLFSTSASGLLDDSWWDRTFWMYSERWPGFYMGLNAPKSGQILSFNDSCTYAFKCFTERNLHSPFSRPGKGYLLYADKNSTEPVLVDAAGKPEPVKWLPEVKKTWADFHWQGFTGLEITDPALDYEKGPGFTRPLPALWKRWIPVRVRSMVLAGNALFIAGPPDVIDPDDPLSSFKGEKGMYLWVISLSTGEKLSGYKLPSAPVFDGMSAAGSQIYISTTDGRVVCLGKKSAG